MITRTNLPGGTGKLMSRLKLGLVGYGRFGRFAVSHLEPYFDISIHDPFVEAEIAADGRVSVTLPEIGVSDVRARRGMD